MALQNAPKPLSSFCFIAEGLNRYISYSPKLSGHKEFVTNETSLIDLLTVNKDDGSDLILSIIVDIVSTEEHY